MNGFKITGLGLLLSLTLWGCGYQMAGRGTSQLPPHLKTIAIPVFENKSGEPTIQRPYCSPVATAHR